MFAGADLPILQVSDLWQRRNLEKILQKDSSPVLLVGDLLEVQRLEELLDKSSECLRQIEQEFSVKRENKTASISIGVRVSVLTLLMTVVTMGSSSSMGWHWQSAIQPTLLRPRTLVAVPISSREAGSR